MHRDGLGQRRWPSPHRIALEPPKVASMATIGSLKRRVHFFVLDLSDSDVLFAKAYPAYTTEALPRTQSYLPFGESACVCRKDIVDDK